MREGIGFWGEVKGSDRSLSFAWKLKDECIVGSKDVRGKSVLGK